jgi:hypothetical protein
MTLLGMSNYELDEVAAEHGSINLGHCSKSRQRERNKIWRIWRLEKDAAKSASS